MLHGSVDESETKLKEIYKILDQTAATPAMHKNTAARYKSRLSAQLNKKRAEA
ncbi:MAG: 30S ribosomal protein S20 [Phycisphaeraceae bacterium]